MSFISQLAINIETTRRLTRGIETEMRDGDNWGYILKERNGYKYRTFKDWLHNSFLLGLTESKETNSRKTPLVCLKWFHNASGDNKKRRLFKKKSIRFMSLLLQNSVLKSVLQISKVVFFWIFQDYRFINLSFPYSVCKTS